MVKLCSDKTFRVELDIFIKLDGIGDVFGHTSKIIQYTASTGHNRLELKLRSRTFILRCPLRKKHCMSIRCSIWTKWLLISRNDILLLIKYKSAGVGEFLVWRDIACKGNHMSVTILTIVTILSCRKRFRCGNDKYIYILFFINTLIKYSFINFWRKKRCQEVWNWWRRLMLFQFENFCILAHFLK